MAKKLNAHFANVKTVSQTIAKYIVCFLNVQNELLFICSKPLHYVVMYEKVAILPDIVILTKQANHLQTQWGK